MNAVGESPVVPTAITGVRQRAVVIITRLSSEHTPLRRYAYYRRQSEIVFDVFRATYAIIIRGCILALVVRNDDEERKKKYRGNITWYNNMIYIIICTPNVQSDRIKTFYVI